MASCACAISFSYGPRFSVCLPIFWRKNDGALSSWFENVGFCIIGLALSLLWGSISFQASLYDVLFGKGTWSLMIVCYNAPGIVALLFQLATDEAFQARASRKSTLWSVRVGLSLALMAALAAAFPFILKTGIRAALLFFVGVVGIAVGLAHGWLYSAAALFPPQATSYLLVGSGVSTLMLAALQLGLHLDDSVSFLENFSLYLAYYLPTAGIIALGLFLATIFFRIPSVVQMIDAPSTDSTLALMDDSDEESRTALLASNSVNADNEPTAKGVRISVAREIILPMATILICTFLQISMVSLVLHVPNQGPASFNLPGVLLWTTSIASLLGSELQSFWSPFSSSRSLFAAACVHFLMLPFIIVYSLLRFWVNNVFTILFMALMIGTNGFLISDSYRMSFELSNGSQDKQRAHVGQILMNVALYVGVYLGMTTPFWLMPLARALGVNPPA